MVVRRRHQGRKARRWRKGPVLPTARELTLLDILRDAFWTLVPEDQEATRVLYARLRRRLLRELRRSPYRVRR